MSNNPRPLLPLSKGHLTLCLASGLLDGLVNLNGSPVVLRAVSSKQKYVKRTEVEIKNGTRHKITTRGERPSLVLRVLDADGKITEYH